MDKERQAQMEFEKEMAKRNYEAETARIERDAKQFDKNESYIEAARDLHSMYNAYMMEGFSEEQAWELVKILFSNSTKKGLF